MKNFCSSCGIENNDTAKFCNECGNPLTKKENIKDGKPFTLAQGMTLRDRYIIASLIKAGGMGAVYKAEDKNLSKICAVKELWPYWVNSEEERDYLIKKFEIEAKLLSKLHHNSLPRVIDYFTSDDRYYLVMDFIEGYDLDALLRKEGRPGLSQDKVLSWAIEICEVLEYLHNHSPPIIYRDLKPSNIMVRSLNNQIVLIDFGIACVIQNEIGSAPRTTIGTMGYIAPEQYLGKPVLASDIYSLGATLYHLLTGSMPVPFDYKPMQSIVSNIPNLLEELVQKCLKLNVSERVQKVQEVRAGLTQLLKKTTFVSKGEVPRAGLRDTLIVRIPSKFSGEIYSDEPDNFEEFLESSPIIEAEEKVPLEKTDEIDISEEFFDEDFIDASDDTEDYGDMDVPETTDDFNLEEFISEVSEQIVEGVFEGGRQFDESYLKSLSEKKVSWKIAEEFMEGFEEHELPKDLSIKHVAERIAANLMVAFEAKYKERKDKEPEKIEVIDRVGGEIFSQETGELPDLEEVEDFIDYPEDKKADSLSDLEEVEDFIDYPEDKKIDSLSDLEEVGDFIDFSEEEQDNISSISVEEDFMDFSVKEENDITSISAEKDFIDSVFEEKLFHGGSLSFLDGLEEASFETTSFGDFTSLSEETSDGETVNKWSMEEDFTENYTFSESFAEVQILPVKVEEILSDIDKEIIKGTTKNELTGKFFKKAQNLISDKKFQEAVKVCEKILTVDPDFLDIYYTLGSIYKEVNRSDLAVESYKKYLKLKQTKATEKLKSKSTVKEDYSISEKSEKVYSGENRSEKKGSPAISREKIKKDTLKELKAIQKEDLKEDKKSAFHEEVKDKQTLEYDMDTSFETIRLSKRKPAMVRLGLGLKRTISKAWETPEKILSKKEPRGSPDSRDEEEDVKKPEIPEEVREKISFARKYFKRGQYTMAIGEYETALENNPEVAILYINLAEVQKKLGEFDNAIGSYLKYLDVKPDDINVHFELGLLYKIKGDRNMAVKYFSRCKELEPDSSLAKRSQKHIDELL